MSEKKLVSYKLQLWMIIVPVIGLVFAVVTSMRNLFVRDKKKALLFYPIFIGIMLGYGMIILPIIQYILGILVQWAAFESFLQTIVGEIFVMWLYTAPIAIVTVFVQKLLLNSIEKNKVKDEIL